MKKLLKIVVSCIFLIHCGHLAAQVTYLGEGKVIKILTDADFYGGCMAYVAFDSADTGFVTSGCDRFVSFGCDGGFISKSAATSNFQSAQLALLTGAEINVFADPSRTYNGNYCLVTRVDVAAQ